MGLTTAAVLAAHTHRNRGPPSLPFGWGAVTVLLVGALLMIVGIVMILFVVGGILAGAGGWLVRLWWIFLLVGAVSGSAGSTVRDREEMRAGDVRVRCRNCGRLNPEYAKFCMSCSQPV